MEEFYKFLSRKSVLNIINSLAKDKPLQFKDIRTGFNISDKTVFKITSELLEINIVKKDIDVREGKHVEVYELTVLGKDIHLLLEQIQQRFEGEKREDLESKDKEEYEIEEPPPPQKRRELYSPEEQNIYKYIENIIDPNTATLQEYDAKELYQYVNDNLEKETFWYANKELIDFIFESITTDYPQQTIHWVFQLLQRGFIDIRQDNYYSKKWKNKFLPRLQDILESPSLSKEIRFLSIETIEHIRDKNGNLSSEVLKYLFDLYQDHYKDKYFNSEEYGNFNLKNRISVDRINEEQQIIKGWIRERLENPKKFKVNKGLKKEYDEIFRKLAKI